MNEKNKGDEDINTAQDKGVVALALGYVPLEIDKEAFDEWFNETFYNDGAPFTEGHMREAFYAGIAWDNLQPRMP